MVLSVSVGQALDLCPGKNVWRAPDWSSVLGIQLYGGGPSIEQQKIMQVQVDAQRHQLT
jgi:hypothetical protein